MARKPPTFNDFVGQSRVIRYVGKLLRGAKELGEPCPSLLLIGRSGAGKTALAWAVAAEYGSRLHPVFAGEDLRPVDLRNTLAEARHGDFVFVDEAHALKRECQELLFLALDEFKIPALRGGRLDRGHTESVASLTLILATNEPGRLRPALRGRLEKVVFAGYSRPELVEIARRAAAKVGVEVTPQAARRLAEAAQGSPRRILQRLENLRKISPNTTRFARQHATRLLRLEGVDSNGRTPVQRQLLRALAASPNGTCPLRGLVTRLRCDASYIQDEVEVYLVDRGWIEISAKGRRLTAAGWAVVAAMAQEAARKGVAP
jgi:Holliday junction DNA helicase RuvB